MQEDVPTARKILETRTTNANQSLGLREERDEGTGSEPASVIAL